MPSKSTLLLLREKFSRWQGLLLLAIYAGYLYLTCFAAA